MLAPPEARAVERAAGLSDSRERRWGWLGGVIGSLVGVGAALVAVVLDGAFWYEAGPFPSVFRERRLLAIDVYLLGSVVVGLGFSLAALLQARRSPFPRSDAYGAGLLGALLSVLGGAILFVRVLALTR